MEPLPAKPFRLLELPHLARVRAFRLMEFLTLINFIGLNLNLKAYISNNVILEEFQIGIRFSECYVLFEGFTWMFVKKFSENLPPPELRTLGPFTHHVSKSNESWEWWNTETDDYISSGLEVARWILEQFPKTKLRVCSCFIFTPELRQLISSWDFSKFYDNSIAMHYNQGTKDFYDDYVKNKQLMAVVLADEIRGMNVKNFDAQPLPMGPIYWFKAGTAFPWTWNVILMNNLNIREGNLAELMSKWLEGYMQSIILVKATNVRNLDASKITAGFNPTEWDIDEMQKYKTKAHLANYFEKQGEIIRNERGEPASIYIDEKAGSFEFVIWESKSNAKITEFFSQLDYYHQLSIQES